MIKIMRFTPVVSNARKPFAVLHLTRFETSGMGKKIPPGGIL